MIEWEKTHGELTEDRPYPAELIPYTRAAEAIDSKRISHLRSAAAMHRAITSHPRFAVFYRELPQAISDDSLPGWPAEMQIAPFRMGHFERR